MKSTDAEKLQSEYTKLVEGLKATEEARDEDLIMSNPVLPQDLLTGMLITYSACAQMSFANSNQRGRPWKYSPCRALYSLFTKIYTISHDTNESHSHYQ